MTELSAHTVKSFDDELHQLRSLVTQMGGLCESMIGGAIEALINRDPEGAMNVVNTDARIDALEAEAERLATTMIALRAPMASDLREIIAALKISAVLERVGDYAKNIAKRAATLTTTAPIDPVVIIPQMARVVIEMIRDALDAFVDRDAEKAVAVCLRDEAVDDFYNSLFRSLLTYMMEQPQNITPSAHLLFIAKNLERMGDHATNVAEMVYFSATGEYFGGRTKSDDTAYAI